MGYATGSTVILHYIEAETAVANLQPSGASQVITYKLLQHWGYDGLLRHGDNVASFYLKRRDNFEGKARAVLGDDSSKKQRKVATWVTPVAGMFLWLRLILPPSNGSQIGDSYTLVTEKAKANGILAVPGMSFLPDKGISCYVRTSFSLIPEDDVEEGFKRLRSVVEEAWTEQGLELPE
jgi:tryptophan aminotransferase